MEEMRTWRGAGRNQSQPTTAIIGHASRTDTVFAAIKTVRRVFKPVIARAGTNAEPLRDRANQPFPGLSSRELGASAGLRDRGNEPRECHGEALRAVAIQLDHHAWRSQARDDKRVFIRRSQATGDPADRLLPWIAAVAKAPSQMTTR
jgi:hypothetical protein